MSYLYGVIANNHKSSSTLVQGKHYELAPEINNALNKKLTYYISIDQSTTCTGIYIYQKDSKLQIVFDFLRTNSDKDEYIRELTILMKLLLKNLKIGLFVMEKPVPSKYRSAGDVLKRLAGYIKSWKLTIPELENVVIEETYPQSWKSKMVDKSKGKNRFNIKREVADDICDRFPLLRCYFSQGVSTDYDGFDAVGILHGFIENTFDETGARKIAGTMEKSNKPIAFFKYLTPIEIKDKQTLFKGIAFKLDDSPARVLTYNDDHSLYENIRICSSDKRCAMTMITNPHIQTALCWEFDLDERPNHYFVMFVFRKSQFTEKQLESVCKFNYCLIIE